MPAGLGASALAAALLLCAPVRADGVLSTDPPCGGDAFSSAQVVEKGKPRRGPITAVPDTLCADLAPQRPAVGVDIQVYPLLVPENGTRRARAPY